MVPQQLSREIFGESCHRSSLSMMKKRMIRYLQVVGT